MGENRYFLFVAVFNSIRYDNFGQKFFASGKKFVCGFCEACRGGEFFERFFISFDFVSFVR